MENWLKDFFDIQLNNWNIAKENFEKLKMVRTKSFRTGVLEGKVQFNPARSISTLAKVDSDSIKKRACFLCRDQRPKEQIIYPILPGWDLLINPFPILPYHFTIASNKHIPQSLDIDIAMHLASELSDMVVFYNDPGAGASAPDHIHYQAVRIEDLPLIKLVDGNYNRLNDLKLPFRIFKDKDEVDKYYRDFPLNAYFWNKEEEVRHIYIPRKAHRPAMYYKELPERRGFSPGAIDMAGILVTPFEEDFKKITSEEIETIYREVGIEN